MAQGRFELRLPGIGESDVDDAYGQHQPELVQPVTWFLPSRHYMAFAQAVVFRGAGFDIVWPQFLIGAGLGSVFFASSLVMFRRSISVAK